MGELVLNVRPVVSLYPKLYSWWRIPEESVWRVARKLLGELREYLRARDARIRLLEPILISSIDDLYSQETRTRIVSGADAILAINAGAGSQPILIGLGDLGLPVVILGLASMGVEEREVEGIPGPEALDAYGELRRRGFSARLAVGFGDVLKWLRAYICLKGLKSSRIALFGTPASYIKEVVTPLEYLEGRLGLEFEVIPLEELIEAYEGTSAELSEVREVVKHVKGTASSIGAFKEDADKALVDAARLYLAMRNMLEERGATATAIDCFGFMDMVYERSGVLRPPCIALSLLRDEGIPAACEADLDALVTMIIMSAISGKPVFMGNLTYISPSKGVIRISHCTIPTSIVKSYDVVSFHESGFGATVRGRVEEGVEVTIARAAKWLDRMLIIRGKVLRSGVGGPLECATRVEVKVGGIERFVEEVEGDHHVLAYGDWSDVLCHVCRMLGTEPVVIG
ncbi:MAG: hypothetical protein DRJ43_00490 [Thermoprotei archaeon]|nr:MAG: hypothetical protein DRJ43_00490 [Thermoprotei archaeon]